MSINQYYPSDWWSYPIPNSAAAAPLHLNHGTSAAAFCSQSAAFCYSHNNNETEEESPEETNKPLFEKSLTPSDVGKLNRLVIPKQHAEKYLPLNNGGGSGGGDTGEKGLVLSFEDEVGKSWRFRYSYWNSSQSYVLTRGWSRFVKEKRLDAGDAVLFLRHPEDVGRLFIGWRRRNSGGGGGGGQEISSVASASANVRRTPPAGGGGGGWSRLVYNNPAGHPYLISQYYQDYCSSSLSYHYQPPNDCPHAADADRKETAAASGNLKRVRLFGVNLDQWESSSSEPLSSPEGSSMARTHYHPYHD
ncbi:hypothetical protein MIMGU_mgv1a021192mg [Erythranthe guttata]|uniref:TF-B3 domain-containing protein n=1 Tax=Erythranthe guttata TaxID=4155 RepID=A0A022RID0_ERYGU|nr:hypothetical protein MIMGU_mgv1a021192mg [Erythranthe guttata]